MRDYRIETASADDVPELIDLFETVFGERRRRETWQWKFHDSKALLGAFNGARSLVARDALGQIVAHAGAVTLPGVHRGRIIPFVQVCDVMVHPAHRGGIGRANLFTRLLRELLSRAEADLPGSFRYGYPGRGPYLVGERAGVYAQIEVAMESEVVPRKSRFHLWRVAPLRWDDGRLDNFWRARNADLPLSLVRDRQYLQWRYASCPLRTYQLLGVYRFGRLVGWVVARSDGERFLLIDILLPQSLLTKALQAVAWHVLDGAAGGDARVWLPLGWRECFDAEFKQTPVVAAHMCWESEFETPYARSTLYYTMGDVDIF
ncbi:GNAT family N-acetyltransferase [Thiorhodococcus mannitoliphagus]|uniref:GNAT family N-acetyltransferase n=1 Tax=Thiorhodococcus mannitoliphagus TaxID=329406 RepID=A0A6P1DLV7_9GAMM|nr:GNAT family N-acetyltransferase [Thiorhodococcus mannitoliphagus]NEX19237.1 GNAT family N-acetyltransferase [Thiorhodococcus mannitoliphagus]